MSRAEVLAQALESTRPLLGRFLAGFDESNRTRQATNLPNHLVWTLGHLALTMLRTADRVRGFDAPQPLPPADWITGDGTKGDVMRFDTESVGFKSQPKDSPLNYPSLKRAIEIYEGAFEKLAKVVRGASDAALLRETKWGGGSIPVADLIPRMIFHNGTHTGQIVDLRRALSMPPVLG